VRGDLSIQGLSQFQDDQGQALLPVLEVGRVLALGLGLEQTDFYLYTGIPELLQPRSTHPGIRVWQSADHAFDAGADDGFAAGWGAAVVRTGLQSHVKVGASSLVAGLGKGVHLGVRPPCAPMGALSHNATMAHDHGPNQRIGTDMAPAFLSLAQGPAHVGRVLVHTI
jgi:hypothetical protein